MNRKEKKNEGKKVSRQLQTKRERQNIETHRTNIKRLKYKNDISEREDQT
jgi:hypothetical protein